MFSVVITVSSLYSYAKVHQIIHFMCSLFCLKYVKKE